MKKGFTIVEVSILFVIFLIVAFLVAPLSLDDTMQAKHTSRWRNVQQDFSNLFYTINSEDNKDAESFSTIVETNIKSEIKEKIPAYKITYLNGSFPTEEYQFKDFYLTYSNATISTKFFETPDDNQFGILMYDVNGNKGPNTWGKDIFGLNLYNNGFEPIGKRESVKVQKQDCSKNGRGIFCSNYYLIGGSFD